MVIPKRSHRLRNLLLLLLLPLTSALFGCDEASVYYNKDTLPLMVIGKKNKEVQAAVDLIKENTIFVKMQGKCFGCVFVSTTGPRAIPILWEVSCEGIDDQ